MQTGFIRQFSNEQIKALDLHIKLVPAAMKLVEQIRIKPNDPFYAECLNLCHLSKNLYNFALYEIKTQYRQNKTLLSYATLAKNLKTTTDFRALPAKVAQQTLKLLQQNVNSFHGSRKSAKVEHKVGFPRYYPSNKRQADGLCVITYTQQAISKTTFNEEGLIALSKTKIKVPTEKIQAFNQLQQVRIVPQSKHVNTNAYFTIEIIYNRPLSRDVIKGRDGFVHQVETAVLSYKTDESGNVVLNKHGNKMPKKVERKETLLFKADAFDNFASLDLNLNQLALYENRTHGAYLYNIRRIKAINWDYNKRKAKLQSRLDNAKNELQAFTSKSDFFRFFLTEETINAIKADLTIKVKKLKNKLKKLTTKRNGRLHYQTHLFSKLISDKLAELHVNTLIIGKNKHMKTGINLGKVTNQHFVSIPFNQLLDKLTYKAHLNGINVFFVEESYTSKTSFFDREKLYNVQGLKENLPTKTYAFVGKRVKRGLFQTQQHKLINADINGALNIARKVVGEGIYQKVDFKPVGSSFPVIKVKLENHEKKKEEKKKSNFTKIHIKI